MSRNTLTTLKKGQHASTNPFYSFVQFFLTAFLLFFLRFFPPFSQSFYEALERVGDWGAGDSEGLDDEHGPAVQSMAVALQVLSADQL